MSKSGIITILVIAAAIFWWVQSNEEKTRIAEQQRQERVNFENSRVSTDDPLMNLAGCMANHAAELSQMAVGAAIYKTDNKKKMSQEEIDHYDEIRNALFKTCSNEHYPKVIEKYKGLTYPNLNYAFTEVMRKDPAVKGYISMNAQISAQVQETMNSLYVK